jgi:cytochrome c peroxidase
VPSRIGGAAVGALLVPVLLIAAADARSAPAGESGPSAGAERPFVPEFEPPKPGTYELPVIATVGDHAVLDSDGETRRLRELTAGRIALVAFIYTSCAEASGCPLASSVMHGLDRRLAERPELARRVRLVSLSFDPERDTPARMRRMRELQAPRTDWAFLTTPTAATLQPILDDFGQSVAKLDWGDGSWSGLYRHVLKVYLLDPQNRVRNVYSSGFLYGALILNDMETLVLEEERGQPRSAIGTYERGAAPQ